MNAINTRTPIPPVIPPHPSSPHGGWLAAFPLRSFLELGAYDTAPGSARGHARNVLAEWRLVHLLDAVVAVVSELVTNAATATGGAACEGERPPVRLWLLGGTGGVMVLVWDAIAKEPVPREVGDEDKSGRGLAIVAWLTGGQWDCYRPSAPHGGKVARALIDRPWRD
jgi:hypothetical protein